MGRWQTRREGKTRREYRCIFCAGGAVISLEKKAAEGKRGIRRKEGRLNCETFGRWKKKSRDSGSLQWTVCEMHFRAAFQNTIVQERFYV